MKRKLFSSILLLIPFTFLTAQDENKDFEMVEQNANQIRKPGRPNKSKK